MVKFNKLCLLNLTSHVNLETLLMSTLLFSTLGSIAASVESSSASLGLLGDSVIGVSGPIGSTGNSTVLSGSAGDGLSAVAVLPLGSLGESVTGVPATFELLNA